MSSLLADGEALLRSIEAPALWVGSSLGGFVALELVARRASGSERWRVPGLVLVDVLPNLPAPERVRAGIRALAGAATSESEGSRRGRAQGAGAPVRGALAHLSG